ncbi:metal-sensitive transcriptional regulator [Kitasatospora sp. NPDC052868]|uniref:metal-sensitive transcriptional regulator n=1 Tax=Kitasatospora sp. NPDC052868 TaxID=3364060 RepID=UPI0037C9F91E
MTTTQARTEPDHAPGNEPHADPAAEAAAGDAAGAEAQHGGHGPHGYSAQKDAHLKRLRRIEGQIRGLQRMVDEDVYCIDVLTQVSAGTKALQSFALSLLEEHLRHCVAAAAEQGGAELDAKVAEATAAIGRLLRS